MNKEFIKY